MKYLFSSDYHFFHKNIIVYENRPFDSIEKMNSEIIRRHNERANEEDVVFCLGDVGFYASTMKTERGEGMPIRSLDLFNQMKGIKYRVRGNHDKESNKLFIPIKSIYLDLANLKIQLIHDPLYADLSSDLIIHGHVHGSWKCLSLKEYCFRLNNLLQNKPKEEIRNYQQILSFLNRAKGIDKNKLFINVSVETNNYYPYTWDEIKTIYNKEKR